MPRYRVLRGTYRAESGDLNEPGDTVELDEAFVDMFPDSKFERLDGDDAVETAAGDGDASADEAAGGEDTAESGAVDDYVEGHSDVDTLEDDLEDEMSESFEDAEALADEHWRTAAAAVQDGDADDFLDELAHVEDRESVLMAVDERRDEIGE